MVLVSFPLSLWIINQTAPLFKEIDDSRIVIDEYFDDAIKTGNSGEIILFHDGYDEALKQGINNNIRIKS